MIRVQKETDVVALCALILAALTAIAQLAAWTRGPRIALLGPDRVALYSDKAPNGSDIVRIAAPLAYANTAEQSYSAILSREEVTMEVAGLSTKQVWNAFGSLARSPGGLAVTSTGLATPQSVSGQSAVSHTTLFAPLIRPCEGEPGCRPTADYLAPDLLSRTLRPGVRLKLRFESQFFEGEAKDHVCEITMTDGLTKRWQAEKAMYATCRKADLPS